MKYWLVRDYEPDPEKCKPTDWDDVVQIQAGDEREALVILSITRAMKAGDFSR